MTDRFSITLTSSIDSGEGWATPKSKEKLDSMISEFGGLWCEDVIGDWQSILEVQIDRARVADYASATHHNADCAMNGEEFLEYVWKLGWNGSEGIIGLAELYYQRASEAVPYDVVVEVADIVEDSEKFAEFRERILKSRASNVVDKLFDEYDPDYDESKTTRPRTAYEDRIHLEVAREIIRRLGGVPEKKEVA